MNITTGILSSQSSTLFNLNLYRQVLISSISSSYKTKIQSNCKIRRSWRSIAMCSLSSSASGASPSVAGEPQTITENNNKPPKQYPWLIVGLGNPGKLYNRTRHNVGFEMVDAIAEAEGISMSSVSFKAFFGKGSIGNIPLLLAKPQTFMNVSGQSVGEIVSFYKIPPKQVLVIFDDLDLPFGKLRLLPKGGHGGHNGEQNVDPERLASARKRLQENYQEAQNAKKQRKIQVMDIHEIPKPRNGFIAKNKGNFQGRNHR